MPLCDTRYPTSFTDAGGGASEETQAYNCDLLVASIPAGNEELQIHGFDSSYIGVIFNVRITVIFRTTAAPIKDTYRFEASLDGTFTPPIVIVPETLFDEPSLQIASVTLGPLSYAEIGTLVLREKGHKGTGKVDPYSVEWDCAFIEIFGDCGAPTYTPSATVTPVSSIPTPTVTLTSPPSSTPTITPIVTFTDTPEFTPTFTPTTSGFLVPITNSNSFVILLVIFSQILVAIFFIRKREIRD
ncbi:MAG: hypothetical protein A2161_09980 [Candidatus Schekmanbacteria bacterium RBG_13_48_7]|uniref:Uncharacterized protein n=1 Tax=Candidatus Schekmanbacteria bacterium RBG_13_48_7 TaxID=1817878 RepID=A0A1F7S0J3_9BACT|nr:MAG: hypothetical protein A2161_09980 [Candidatus Schekmanbacteria bacterium RBG_13_48_7]